MITVEINDNSYTFEQPFTIMQACDSIGIEIPRFCYHESLKIAGNCRMCLVEVTPGPPKPQPACALTIADGMKIQTASEMARKAQGNSMEFLLANHPLDCPVCDQGGECDLQDQAFTYGKGVSVFEENKRAVENKNFGPLVATNMNRCIHCTRCVRFMEDVAGTRELGGFYRGNSMEISTFDNTPLQSNLSGNIIDLCPVGALTSKPSAFTYRS